MMDPSTLIIAAMESHLVAAFLCAFTLTLGAVLAVLFLTNTQASAGTSRIDGVEEPAKEPEECPGEVQEVSATQEGAADNVLESLDANSIGIKGYDIEADSLGKSLKSGKTLQVELEREPGESWGFAWHVRAYASQRFLVAGVDPNSPAGRWMAKQKALGLPEVGRNDELIGANGATHHGALRRELVVADKVQLRFLLADPESQLQEPSPESLGEPVCKQRKPTEINTNMVFETAARRRASSRPSPVHRTQKAAACGPEEEALIHPDDKFENKNDFGSSGVPDHEDRVGDESEPEEEQPVEGYDKERLERKLLKGNLLDLQARTISRTQPAVAKRDFIQAPTWKKDSQAKERARSDPPPVGAYRWTSKYFTGHGFVIPTPLCEDEPEIPRFVDGVGCTTMVPVQWNNNKQNLSPEPDRPDNDRDSQDSNIFSSSSGSESQSQKDSSDSKCPSTDWEFMMDMRGRPWAEHREGMTVPPAPTCPPSVSFGPVPSQQVSRITSPYQAPAFDLPASSSNDNVVIVAGPQALALRTAAALGSMLTGGALSGRNAPPTSAHVPPHHQPLQPLPPQHSQLPPQHLPRHSAPMAPAPVPAPLLPAPALLEATASLNRFQVPPPPLVAPGHVPHGQVVGSSWETRLPAQAPLTEITSRLLPLSGLPAAPPPLHAPTWWPRDPPPPGPPALHSLQRIQFPAPLTSQGRAAEPAGDAPGARRPGRSGSAPPACRPSAEPETAAAKARKKTYRAGHRVTAKRMRAALRLELAGLAPQASSSMAPAAAEPPSLGPLLRGQPAVSEPRDEVTRVAETATPSSTTESAVPAAKAYYKPRRRAGVRVRQRMEYAIAQRKNQAKDDSETPEAGVSDA